MSERFSIGVDVGGTTIKGLLLNNSGQICDEVEAVDTPLTGAEDVVAVATQVARDIEKRSGRENLPIGVCVPGIVDEVAGVGVLSANLGWKDAPLRHLLSQALGRDVALGHDVRSGALGEATWGVRQENCYYVAIGTGIAAGLVLGSRLAPSAPWAGEIGQTAIAHPDDLDTIIPMEQVCSAAGIAKRAITAGLVPPGSGAKAVQDLAESSHPGAKKARNIQRTALLTTGRIIGIVLHQIGNIPVVIGGGLSKGGDAILDTIREGIASASTIFPAPTVMAATLGSKSQTMGAATLAFNVAGIDLHLER